MTKSYFEKRQSRLTKKIEDLTNKMNASEDVKEMRAIATQIDEIRSEIAEITEEIVAIEADEARSAATPNVVNPMATYGVRSEADTDMEYREAFKNYVQNGVAIPKELRAAGDAGQTVTGDIGALIPETIINELIKDVEHVHGALYSRVRKLNIKGGVKFPISDLGATFTWINEGTSGAAVKAGDAKQFVEFSYNIGEIKIATSLLASIVSLPLFESEVARLIAEAYVEAMEIAIVNGSGVNQPLGITKDTRVTNSVTFTATKMGDWKSWHTELFAKVPLALRGKGVFVFPASTVETYLETMSDKNDNPIFKQATDGEIGDVAGKFFGREVILVEPDLIEDFDTAKAGDVVGIYFDPAQYAINTNLQFGVQKYFDQDTNAWVNKALVIADGKMLNTNGCYLIKKGGTSSAS